METNLRNADLADLAALLTEQQNAKVDVVVQANQLRSEDGVLIVPGATDVLTEDGVGVGDGRMRPTEVCDGTLADKLGIPVRYLRSVREDGLTVPGSVNMDSPHFVKEWLGEGAPEIPLIDAMLNAHFAADARKVLVRGFHSFGEGEGIARAVLSDQFRAIDNLDSLMAVLDGVKRTGKQVDVQKVDLSERAMRVHFVAPEITALAPQLLAGYRSPFDHGGGTDGPPIVFAGFVASNSETGGGAFQIVPRLVVQVCKNGMTITKDAMRQVHLGGKLDTGIVRWSEDTLKANVDLIAKQTTDAVATFLDVDYMTGVLAGIEAQAATPIEGAVTEALRLVGTRLRYTKDEQETLLSHFITGGQTTAGGVFNAVTAMAQSVDDPDRAAEIEASALDALALVG